MAFYFSVFLFWSGHNHTPKEKSKSAWVYPLQPIRFKSSSLIRVGERWWWPIYSQPSSNRTVFYNLLIRYRPKLTNLYSWKRFIRFERIIRSGRIIREDDYDVIVSRTVKMVDLKTIYSDLISWPEQTIWTRAERTRTRTARANFMIPIEHFFWNFQFENPLMSIPHENHASANFIFARNLSNGPGQGQIRNPRTWTWMDETKTKVTSLHPYFHWNLHVIRSTQ